MTPQGESKKSDKRKPSSSNQQPLHVLPDATRKRKEKKRKCVVEKEKKRKKKKEKRKRGKEEEQ